ncbi:MAG: RluA family pseudouridine synthase [Bacillota bacterium]|nr:RluA family pseudouridine synthase [Bacillota bacterium]
MSSRFKIQWVIDQANTGKLIKEFLKEQEISKRALTDIKFQGGSILVHDREENVRFKLREGDILKLIFPQEIPSKGVKGENLPLEIVFEDDYLLVVNKPTGMNTIPSREHPSGSLAHALIGYYERAGTEATSHIVTRLDRNTSGLVLIAKHRHIHHLFSKMQQSGGVKRTYEAFVEGNICDSIGTIEQPIGRKDDSIIEREVREDGQYACTHFKVVEKLESFTHVELQLETGRTHQIRVHMSFIGHPLLGDDLYGGDISLIKRQALHCKQVRFLHPIKKKEVSFSAEMPGDMRKVLQG